MSDCFDHECEAFDRMECGEVDAAPPHKVSGGRVMRPARRGLSYGALEWVEVECLYCGKFQKEGGSFCMYCGAAAEH